MYEIEIKAWVCDRQKVMDVLNSRATYCGFLDKSDTYYAMPVFRDNKALKVRIRKEKKVFKGKETEEILFTYKNKEVKTGSDGTSIEVNVEKECVLSDSEALDSFLMDIGGKIDHTKKKLTENWTLETPSGTANIELCNIPPLGEFLEIEIVAEENNPQFISAMKAEEMKIMTMCGLTEKDLEPRFYNDMLKEYESKGVKNV